jgi:hypothetical protein
MERTLMWGIDCFCKELINGGAQGLCECLRDSKCYCEDLADGDEYVCNDIPPFLKDEVESCSKKCNPGVLNYFFFP